MPSATSLAKAPTNRRRDRPRGGRDARPLFWLLVAVVPALLLLGLGFVFPEIWRSGALGMLVKGGLFMWPILFLGIAAAAVCIERYRSLKMLDTSAEDLRREVIDLLADNRLEDALELCDRSRGPVAAVLANGLRKYLVLQRLDHDPARTEEQVIKSMENYGVHIVAALERHLPILATVSSSAPMLGFLGTVQGMIIAFGNIVSQSGKANIVELAASGIERALLTTCFGLIVGIPAFIAFNYFTSVINQFVLEVETSASELIEAVTLQLSLNRGDQKG
ncbi:MAG: MotA/TolQ/ExbB proton channel family protein [Verrucomicrobiales bacterium]